MRSIRVGIGDVALVGKKIRTVFVVFLACMLLPVTAECFWPLSSPPEKEAPPPPEPNPFVEEMGQAGDLQSRIQEMAAILARNMESQAGLLVDGLSVCSFVELKKLYRTSSFGRYLAEQLMNEFQQQGYTVVEVRKGNSVIVQEKYGEYGLSRKPEEIGSSIEAGAMLTGTYVPVRDHILVSAKIVDNRDATLLSSATMIFPRDELGDILLSDSRTASTKRHEVTYLKRLEL